MQEAPITVQSEIIVQLIISTFWFSVNWLRRHYMYIIYVFLYVND